jgi:hypothetical protein
MHGLTDGNGDDVRLKQGTHVEATVTAEPTRSTAAIDEGRNLALSGFRLISCANPVDASD